MSENMWQSLPMTTVHNGPTDYIDGVEPRDLQGVAVCAFTDPFRRRGVAMRIRVSIDGRVIEEGIYTVFERYTDDPGLTVMCRSHCGGVRYKYNDHPGSEYRSYYFDSIVGAHTRLTPSGADILRELLRERVYRTPDGHAAVELVDSYSGS